MGLTALVDGLTLAIDKNTRNSCQLLQGVHQGKPNVMTTSKTVEVVAVAGSQAL